MEKVAGYLMLKYSIEKKVMSYLQKADQHGARKVQTPEEVVNINDEVNVRIIKVDAIERKIGLSLRTMKGAPEDETGVKSETDDKDVEKKSETASAGRESEKKDDSC